MSVLETIAEKAGFNPHKVNRAAAIASFIGTTALTGTLAGCLDNNSPTGPSSGGSYGNNTKHDTVYVTRVDTLRLPGKTDTLRLTDSTFNLAMPVKKENYQVATLCPEAVWVNGNPTPRWEFSLRPRAPFMGGQTVELVSRPFSNGCPEQKTPRFAESQTIGSVFNGMIYDPSNPNDVFHGNIMEIAYVTPVVDKNSTPGSVERGTPNQANYWKVQFARQTIGDARGFTNAVRNGLDIVIKDRITGDIYTSEASSEIFVPISGPYLAGSRLVPENDPAKWVSADYKSRAQRDSAARVYVNSLR
jgi:hypothetical protein